VLKALQLADCGCVLQLLLVVCSPCDVSQPGASAYIEYASCGLSLLNRLRQKLSILGADQLQPDASAYVEYARASSVLNRLRHQLPILGADQLQPDASAFIEYAACGLNRLHHQLSRLGADQLACLLQTKAVYMPLQEPVKWRG